MAYSWSEINGFEERGWFQKGPKRDVGSKGFVWSSLWDTVGAKSMVLRSEGGSRSPKRDFGRQLQRNQWFPRARGNEICRSEGGKSSGAGLVGSRGRSRRGERKGG